MGHVWRIPDTIKVTTATLSARLSNPLRRRIRSCFVACGGVRDAVRALVGRNSDAGREQLQKESYKRPNDCEGAVSNFDVPDTAVNVSRVDAVDGDVSVLFRVHEAGVQFGEPALEVELIVVVQLDALASVAVEIGQIVYAEVGHARSGADDSGSFSHSQRRQQAEGEQHMRNEVDLMNKLEAVFGSQILQQTTRIVSHAGIVAEDIQGTASVEPALGKGLDGLEFAHVDFPPFDLALLVPSGFGGRSAVFRNFRRVFLLGTDARSQDQVGAAFGEEQRRLLANATVGAGNDDPFAAEVFDGHILFSESLAVGALQ